MPGVGRFGTNSAPLEKPRFSTSRRATPQPNDAPIPAGFRDPASDPRAIPSAAPPNLGAVPPERKRSDSFKPPGFRSGDEGSFAERSAQLVDSQEVGLAMMQGGIKFGIKNPRPDVTGKVARVFEKVQIGELPTSKQWESVAPTQQLAALERRAKQLGFAENHDLNANYDFLQRMGFNAEEATRYSRWRDSRELDFLRHAGKKAVEQIKAEFLGISQGTILRMDRDTMRAASGMTVRGHGFPSSLSRALGRTTPQNEAGNPTTPFGKLRSAWAEASIDSGGAFNTARDDLARFVNEHPKQQAQLRRIISEWYGDEIIVYRGTKTVLGNLSKPTGKYISVSIDPEIGVAFSLSTRSSVIEAVVIKAKDIAAFGSRMEGELIIPVDILKRLGGFGAIALIGERIFQPEIPGAHRRINANR